jgi:hypothetical protein
MTVTSNRFRFFCNFKVFIRCVVILFSIISPDLESGDVALGRRCLGVKKLLLDYKIFYIVIQTFYDFMVELIISLIYICMVLGGVKLCRY